jgi:hypothetical protein
VTTANAGSKTSNDDFSVRTRIIKTNPSLRSGLVIFHLYVYFTNSHDTGNGDTWRRHRRIVGPAFNNKTFVSSCSIYFSSPLIGLFFGRYDLVWTRTASLYYDMMTSEGWTDKTVVNVPIVQELTSKVCLLTSPSTSLFFFLNLLYTVRAPRVRDMRIRILRLHLGLTLRRQK